MSAVASLDPNNRANLLMLLSMVLDKDETGRIAEQISVADVIEDLLELTESRFVPPGLYDRLIRLGFDL